MTKINTHEAKLNFAKLITQVANGETITITRFGKDFAEITPIKKTTDKRISGQDNNIAWIAKDFNNTLFVKLQTI